MTVNTQFAPTTMYHHGAVVVEPGHKKFIIYQRINMRRNGKEIQAIGKAGEERARWFFAEIGARCVEKISTPMLNIKGKAVYCATSSVDFTIALPCPGKINPYIACRVEVKVCDDDRLVHSRLSDHQVKWLTEWHYCGFWSFVLWVHKGCCYLIPYPNELFKHGKSISIDQVIMYKK